MSDLVNFIRTHDQAFKSKPRLISLYSDFSRLKSSNPDGYAANVAAWISALSGASAAGLMQESGCSAGLFSFRTGTSLEAQLECSGVGRPVALGAVVNEATSRRDLLSAHDFFASKTSIIKGKSWTQFELPTAWQVAQWGLRQVGIMGNGPSKLADGEFVIVANLEAATQKFLAHLAAHPPSTATSHVHSLQTFTHEYAYALSPSKDHALTASDFKLLLTYLSRDKNIITLSMPASSSSQITIKLPTSNNTAAEPVTSNDESIAQLRTLQHTLTTQTTILTNRIQSLDQTARAAISTPRLTTTGATQTSTPNTLTASNKTRAMTALRQKQQATTTLNKRQASLAQIDGILTSIDDAASQAEVVSALESGTGVLRDLNKQIGGVERIDSVMDAFHEGMADTEATGSAIAEAGAAAVDESEVDEEFEELEREEQRKREEKEKREREREEARLRASLPDAPTTEVGEAKDSEGDVSKRMSAMSLDDAGAGKTAGVPPRIAEGEEGGTN